MTSLDWVVTAVAAAAAAVLLVAGVAKLAAPGPLRSALAELAPRRGGRIGPGQVRAFGALELLVAIGLLVAPARIPSAAAAAALGTGFAVLGALGLARRSTVPCGCFGAASGRPLGWLNVGLGLALCSPWPAFAAAGAVPAAGSTAAAAMLAAVIAILLSLLRDRRHIRLPRRAGSPVPVTSEVI